MPGAIASVACANGKIHHLVCIKKDGNLGHIIAQLDPNNNVTWFKGDLTGVAHKLSQIAIGCPNPTDESPSLDICYQAPSHAIVTKAKPVGSSTWSGRGNYESGQGFNKIYVGTSLSINYTESFIYCWQKYDNTIGVTPRGQTDLKLPPAVRYHFNQLKNVRHFYYLDKDNDGYQVVRHYTNVDNGNFWDTQPPIGVTSDTFDFQVVGDMTTIIDVKKSDGAITKSSVQLYSKWRADNSRGFDVISPSDVQVAFDHGLTLYARSSEEHSGFITYVDRVTGNWFYHALNKGQSEGYPMPIEFAKGWFDATGGQVTVPEVQHAKPVVVDTPKVEQPAPAPAAPPAPVVSEPEPALAPAPAPTPAPVETKPEAAPEVKRDEDTIPEWIRKFCKDVLVPRTTETLIKAIGAKTGHYKAVLAPTSQLWDLGSEPLKYVFIGGKYGGNNIQKQKVRDSIVEWTWYANIKFQEAGKGETAPIKIYFDPNDGSWSVVGNDAWKEDADSATMNLGWVDGHSSRLTREERAVILHEFGHALGLLHEHQSPAHGGRTVKDPQAAIDFYMKDQGWSEEMVMDQVIRPYNLNDVSNFSQVDPTSIMHYYQPAIVTGGDPIEYNYVLSDLDKAYMTINYPRSVDEEKAHSRNSSVTLESALQSVGLTDDDPKTANKILAVRNEAGKDDIDVGQIRRLFTAWAKAKHTVTDEKLEPETRQYLRGIIEHSHGIKPKGDVSIETSEPDPYPCQYTRNGDTPALASDPKKARAVVDTNIFTEQPKFVRKDLDSAWINFTWTIVNDPTVSNGKTNRVASEWDRALVQEAIDLWISVTSVDFTWVEPSKAATADLVIVFQDINPADGTVYDADNSVNRSAFRPVRWNAEHIKKSQTMLQARKLAKWKPFPTEAETDSAYYLSIQPAVPHDLVYRGIVTEKTAKNPATVAKKWPPIIRSNRTIVHELGHFFGLDHENIGMWCHFWENDQGKQALLDAAKETNINALTFDNASVMDSLRSEDGIEKNHPWNTLGFKTVYAPSAIDLSNLAMFHSGPHLATLNDDKKAFTLVGTKEGVTIISAHCAILNVPADVVKELETLAKKGQWTEMRNKYLNYHKKRLSDQATVIAKMTDMELEAARKIVPVPVAHGQKYQAPSDTNVPSPDKAFDAPMPLLKEILWSKLSELFGPSPKSSSFLSIQSPARYLDKNEFSYKMEGLYSNFVKPVVVNEAEFRLTDQLFAPSRVVGAPNGQSLSLNYEIILNNLIPRYVAADIDIRKAREKMRNWLLEETSSQNAFFVNDTRIIGPHDDNILDGDEVRDAVRSQDQLSGPRIASRMEVCQKLMQEYLEASSTWKSKHSAMIQEAMHVQTDGRLQKLEDAAREIANTASVQNSKLSAKYADVVVRGHLHTVRECLAQLDIKSTAEFLQDAKDSLRESALSSLYGASRVLPVIMTPMDWSESLDTSFDPHDLSSDPEIIELNITAKTRQIDNLREQLSALQHNVKGDEASLRVAMDEASDKYSEAQANLAGSYTESARLLATRIVKAAVPASTLGDGITWAEGATDTQKSSLASMITKFDPAGTVNELFQQMDKASEAQRTMMSAGAKFSQRQTDWVRAKSATTAEQEASVSRKIEAATKDLESLNLQLTAARLSAAKREAQLAKVDPEAIKKNAEAFASNDPTREIILPTMADIAANATDTAPTAGSRWIALTINSKDASQFESSVAKTDASQTDWAVNFFGFASGGSKNTKSEGSSENSAQSSNLDVEISMNCTMVTADRSSWFQPQFFGMSDAFMRNNNQVSWNKGWDEDWKKDTYKAVDAAVIEATKPLPDAFLPCFPTGYIIAKDVLIKISRFKIKTVADKKYLDEKTTSGGSFLFFSTSKTTQKTEDSSSSAFQMASDGMIVRIPGPQVIGYVQQMLPYDGTHPFKMEEALRPDIFLPGDEITISPSLGQGHGQVAYGQAPQGQTDKGQGRVVARGMEPNTRPTATDRKKFTVRSTKPQTNTSTNGHDESVESSGKPARAQAPRPKQSSGSGDHDDANGNGDAHEHDDGEMDHAMRLISAKLREKLVEPGFLEKLLSGK